MPPLPGRLWLVGCGNMAGAMLARWLEAGLDPARVTVIRPSGAPSGDGVRVLTAFPDEAPPALLLLGVKPQKVDEVARAWSPRLGPDTRLISILAGIEIAALRARFPRVDTVVKAMPNTPVRLGKGVVNLFTDGGADVRAAVDALMRPLGRVEWFDDEELFRAAGILSGAGPAFVFRFIDALARAGARIGLDPGQSARLAAATVEGAGLLAAASDDSPAALADRVASPGGTTRAGLDVLDRDGALDALVAATLAAGLRRSGEMARETRPAAD